MPFWICSYRQLVNTARIRSVVSASEAGWPRDVNRSPGLQWLLFQLSRVVMFPFDRFLRPAVYSAVKGGRIHAEVVRVALLL